MRSIALIWLLRTAPVLFPLVMAVHAQNDATNLLLRTRHGVLDTFERLPRYVCTQTIDRARYEPDPAQDGLASHRSCDTLTAEFQGPTWKRKLDSWDRLRLDVALDYSKPNWGSAMYSWAGEDHFSDLDLFELIPNGTLETGSFSSLLRSIFSGDVAAISYNGDITPGGRTLSEFGFRVPLEKSHYMYFFNRHAPGVMLEYGGTFLVDPANSDLVRLTVFADRLPKQSQTCEISQTLNYSRVRFNDANLLLPKESRLTFLQADGSESENVVHYSACREFHGESKVRFEKMPEGGVSEPARDRPLQTLSLPSGLPFTLMFTQQIDVTTAAAGDSIAAKLEGPIRDKSSAVLVPESAIVTGRIVKLKHFETTVRPTGPEGRERRVRRPSLIIEVKLESVKMGGSSYPLRASFTRSVGRFPKLTGVLGHRVEVNDFDEVVDPDNGVFAFFDSNPEKIITSGLESNWRTH